MEVDKEKKHKIYPKIERKENVIADTNICPELQLKCSLKWEFRYEIFSEWAQGPEERRYWRNIQPQSPDISVDKDSYLGYSQEKPSATNINRHQESQVSDC